MERGRVQSPKSKQGKSELYTRVSKEALKKKNNQENKKIPQGQLRKTVCDPVPGLATQNKACRILQTSLVAAEQEIVRGGTPGRGDCWADTFLMKFKHKAMQVIALRVSSWW